MGETAENVAAWKKPRSARTERSPPAIAARSTTVRLRWSSCRTDGPPSLADIELWEINEAFAAQVLPCVDELKIDPDKVNVHGGAIALGHPFGQTGARMTTTLINGLRFRDARTGVVTMCAAGGRAWP